ncbi:thiamine phosphate synthase [Ferroplasma sp.]|uniref:thiamine phosphate synthase n=1 Tax=Ferroplasma sp. TaxID=2591003 RepID=UPI00307D08D6
MKLKGLYLVTPDYFNDQVIKATERAVKSGVDILQYRNKKSSFREKFENGRKLKTICDEYDIPFIIDDDPILMDVLDADGVHIGKDDVPFDYVKTKFPGKIIGVSTYGNVDTAVKYEKLGADYVAFGSFFHTDTKEDATMCDIKILKNIDKLKIPVFAIGGINRENVDALLNYGISGIAVVSAIYSYPDIESQVKYFKEELKKYGIE